MKETARGVRRERERKNKDKLTAQGKGREYIESVRNDENREKEREVERKEKEGRRE